MTTAGPCPRHAAMRLAGETLHTAVNGGAKIRRAELSIDAPLVQAPRDDAIRRTKDAQIIDQHAFGVTAKLCAASVALPNRGMVPKSGPVVRNSSAAFARTCGHREGAIINCLSRENSTRPQGHPSLPAHRNAGDAARHHAFETRACAAHEISQASDFIRYVPPPINRATDTVLDCVPIPLNSPLDHGAGNICALRDMQGRGTGPDNRRCGDKVFPDEDRGVPAANLKVQHRPDPAQPCTRPTRCAGCQSAPRSHLAPENSEFSGPISFFKKSAPPGKARGMGQALECPQPVDCRLLVRCRPPRLKSLDQKIDHRRVREFQ